MNKKRMLSAILAVSFLLTLMPTAFVRAAQAAPAVRAIELVQNGEAPFIAGAQASNVYFGTYYQDSSGYIDDPIKWRVLSNAEGKLFLLSDKNLDAGRYRENYGSTTWEDSTIRAWLNGDFFDTAFLYAEQAAIPEAHVFNNDSPYGTEAGNNTWDKVFLLSIDEAREEAYGFPDTDNNTSIRRATNTDYAKQRHPYTDSGEYDNWWLRSPGKYSNYAAYVVNGTGAVNTSGNDAADSYAYVRPALNIDLDAVLFVSPAQGGKQSGATGADALTAVGNYTGSDWKLTLRDESRSDFTAAFDSRDGDVWTIRYSGAKINDGEYISAIIVNGDGAVTYYGRLAEADDDDQTVTVNLAGKMNDGDKLYVFNETCRGDAMTDGASALQEITPSETPAAPAAGDNAIRLVKNGTAANIAGAQASSVYFGTYYQTSDGAGGYKVDPIRWRVLSNADGKLFLLSDKDLDVAPYHQEGSASTWEDSTIRAWLNGDFFIKAFFYAEQQAIPEVFVVNDDNLTYGTDGGNETIDKVFLLSIDEAMKEAYGFPDNYNDTATRQATHTDYAKDLGVSTHSNECDDWWLRSPGNGDYTVAYVDADGAISNVGHDVDHDFIAVRPAVNIDLDSVLFTSAAAGGKLSDTVDANALTAVGNYDGSDWKLTVKDKAHGNFSVDPAKVVYVSNRTVLLVSYTGAATGDNEYISAIITDSDGNVKYYGRMAEASSAANAYVTIKLKDYYASGDTLYVFNEQYNGDYMTDYASELFAISPANAQAQTQTTIETEITGWTEGAFTLAANAPRFTYAPADLDGAQQISYMLYDEHGDIAMTGMLSPYFAAQTPGAGTFTFTGMTDADKTELTKWNTLSAGRYALECTLDVDERYLGDDVVVEFDVLHDWTFTGFTWTGDAQNGYTAAKANYVCKTHSSQEMSVNLTPSSQVVAPNCEAGGKTVFTAAIAAADAPDGVARSEQKEALLTAADGHDWTFTGFTWTGDAENGYTAAQANYVCKTDETHIKAVEATVTATVTEATTTAPGKTTYTATVTAGDSPDGAAHSSADDNADMEAKPTAQIVYSFRTGEPVWTKGTDAALDITVDRSVDNDTTLARFVGVRVDETALTEEDFEASAGSLRLSIKPAFLETLAVGTHTLLITFTDGDAPAMTFTVEAAPDVSPQTGDDGHLTLWLSLLLLSCLGIAGWAVTRTKRAFAGRH